MNIKKLLGKRIQEIRKSKKLTQEFIAENIGMDPASLSNIENGRYYPTAENLEKIIKILDVTPKEIFTFKHLCKKEELIKEMCEAMTKNENLAKLMYKFFSTVK